MERIELYGLIISFIGGQIFAYVLGLNDVPYNLINVLLVISSMILLMLGGFLLGN